MIWRVGEPDSRRAGRQRRSTCVCLLRLTNSELSSQSLDDTNHRIQGYRVIAGLFRQKTRFCEVPEHWQGLTCKQVRDLRPRAHPLAKGIADVGEAADGQSQDFP